MAAALRILMGIKCGSHVKLASAIERQHRSGGRSFLLNPRTYTLQPIPKPLPPQFLRS
jgi:hypothetical protein